MGRGQAAREGILQPRQDPPPQLGHFVINSLGTGSSVGLSTLRASELSKLTCTWALPASY